MPNTRNSMSQYLRANSSYIRELRAELKQAKQELAEADMAQRLAQHRVAVFEYKLELVEGVVK